MTEKMKIIVTGDDFGKSENVNNAIEFCHNAGILTSTSLVATGEAFESAVNISRRNPRLGIGVHLVIDSFAPISKLPSSIINPLTNMFNSPEVTIKNVKKFKCRSSDLIKEYCLQIEKVLNYGISITHLDHHHHLHLYWPVLNAMIKVARKYNIRFIRSQKLILPRRKKVLKNIYRIAHQLYLKGRLATVDGQFELVHEEFEKMYESLAKLLNLNCRIVEIVVHPCREKEHEVTFLTNERVINLIKSCNLVNFGNI